MRTKYIQNHSLRSNRGAAVIALCLSLASLMLIIAFFVFDMNRCQMAQRQLTAISDAAALAGSAMLTSKDVSFDDSTLDLLYTTQLAAEQYSRNMFAMGNILGKQISDPAVGAVPAGNIPIATAATTAGLANPSAGSVNLLIQLCAPINNYAVVAPGTSNGRAILVQANYGYVPYLNFLGVTNVSLPSTSTGSLQKLCVVVVFDCSGSMDDNTVVTFVERRWTTSTDSAAAQAANNGRGEYSYNIVGSPGSAASAGQLWQYTGLDYNNQPNGTCINVLPPQNLDRLGIIYNGVHTSYPSNSNKLSDTEFDLNSLPLALDYSIRAYVCWLTNSQNGITYPNSGTQFAGPIFDNDFGTPPGNCPVKYGAAASGSVYGTTAGSHNTTLNVWNSNYSMCPGAGNSPGYQYPGNGVGSAPASDGNTYFYDPYAMPGLYTGSTYTPFTDMVANITSLTFPVANGITQSPTQPLYGPSPFSGFSYKLSPPVYTVSMAENTVGTAATYNSTVNELFEYDCRGATEIAGNTYKFSSIAYVVEASRGNLDLDNNGNAANYVNALLSFGNCNSITQPAKADCQAGYQKAYQRLAMYCMQPYATAIDGASRFFMNLVSTSDCIFGLVGFSVAPATISSSTANSYVCKYLNAGYSNGPWSLGLAAPANASGSITPIGSIYSCYSYQPFPGTNPNFWLTNEYTADQYCMNNYCGPAGGDATQGAGMAYNASYNTSGPTAPTFSTMTELLGAYSGGLLASSDNSMYAFNNPGFQIPRVPIVASTTAGGTYNASAQLTSFTNVASSNWSFFAWGLPNNNGPTGSHGAGCNSIFHARPLYDTDSLEALETALYQLTNTSALNAMTGSTFTKVTSLPTVGFGSGAKKAIVFFTDGVPTDDISPYSNYTSNIVTPAQTSGVAIYSIGLALNSNVKVTQSAFLQTLTNNGANGSQYFQVTSASSLASTFTGIARQLAQCSR